MPKLIVWWALAVGVFVAYHEGRAVALTPQTPLASDRREAQSSSSGATGSAGQLVGTFCVPCHNSRSRAGGLALDVVDFSQVTQNAEILEKVLLKTSTGQMPPPAARRPTVAALQAFSDSLERALDAEAARRPRAGVVGVRRLTRTEYTNAVRDLLDVELGDESLPFVDESEAGGFDNSAASLRVSPALMERYVSAARKISRLAVGDVTFSPTVETKRISARLIQDGRVSEDLPFGSRGGSALRHRFPLSGEYVISVRLGRNQYDYLTGMGRPQELEVRIDGVLVKRFTVGGDAPGVPSPRFWTGTPPSDAPWEVYMHEADAGLNVRVPVEAGTRLVGVSFVDAPWEEEGALLPPQRGVSIETDEKYDGNAAVAQVAIAGPFAASGPGETLSRQKVFVCEPEGTEPEDSMCARTILSGLARRAYRRPVTDGDIQTLLEFFRVGRAKSGFDGGIRYALERLLVDPDFLFRVEYDPPDVAPGGLHPVSGVELASRLSFFLWSSIPDDELLDLAEQGKLHAPDVLADQVVRMVADPKANALIDNFAMQWLELRKVQSVSPDPYIYWDFDENLREAFLKETTLFLESQLRGDRPLLDLVTANYTFINDRLAQHYGIPGVYGSEFRRMDFTDGRRGGLLGQASLLTATSYPNRTSPVLRGKWILDNLLGIPPPPPPPNVPALEATRGEGGKALSVREQLEQHRKNPVCSSCHVKMDPLGFALENYGALGEWRTQADKIPVDASAQLPGGEEFSGVDGLREVLVSRCEQFVTTFTTELLSYALGRKIEPFDRPVIRGIVREAAAEDYRWSSVLRGLVQSTPFQMREQQ